MKLLYTTLYFYLFFSFSASSFSQPSNNVSVEFIGIWETGSQPNDVFVHPEDLSIDPLGHLYIADTGNHRLLKFSKQGAFLSEIGGFGWENEQFDHPAGIDATNGLDVFVADHRNERIVRYDKNLHYISIYTNNDDLSENLQFGFPKDVAISDQGELFVLDGENRRILKLDVLGNAQLSFGDFDSGEGVLQNPQKLCIYRSDFVLVSDSGSRRVVKYDLHGNFLGFYTDELFISPSGIAIYHNLLFISDSLSGTIFVFLTDGSLYGKIGKNLPGGVHLKSPVDLGFYGNILYVLDSSNHRLVLLQWSGWDGEMAD